MNTRVKIALLLGGDSTEREISWKSAKSMYSALSQERFEISVIDLITIHAATALSDLAINTTRLDANEYDELSVWWSGLVTTGCAQRVSWQQLIGTLSSLGITVVLPALHGGWGEDGTLQTLLDVSGIRYAGSPARSAMLAIDKGLGKTIARSIGISTPQSWIVDSPTSVRPAPQTLVVKPNFGGSSVGISILDESASDEQWHNALQKVLADGDSILVEEFIAGAEITVAVMGSGATARVLPLVEVVPNNQFFDFESKYSLGGAQHIIPPRIRQELQSVLCEQTLQLHFTLGCRGITRSDWIVTERGVPYFLEMNTHPGMTRTSLVPDAAREAGISFESLIEMLVEEALK